HHVAAGVRIAGAEVDVREPAAAAAMAPFGSEHHEVERLGRLDLEPRRAARAGVVARIQRLGHEPLVAGGERSLVEGSGLARVGGHDARDAPRGWNELL